MMQKLRRVPDVCCRDGLRPLLGFPRPPGSPQTPARSSREFSVIWAGRRGAEKEGLGVVSGTPLKAKQDVWSQILSCYSPPLLQLRGRRQHDTSQPESSRKMRKGCGGNHTGRHQTGHNLRTAVQTGYVKACTVVFILISLCPRGWCSLLMGL